MAEDSEKRFKKIMDKLYLCPKPKPKPKPKPSPASGGMSSLGKRAESSWRGNHETVPRHLASTIGSKEVPPRPCRPWDRGDLMRRLATFKAMTWFGKPKAVSPVNCARRGWINVEMDTISCEACGARLLFSTSAFWTMQQVEKAAAVFSLKLDNGHKLLCPWIDNICDETLALFPPTPALALVEGYKDRFSALLQLSALPIVSSSAIDYMMSPQLEHFLSQSSSTTCILDNGIQLINNSRSEELENTSEVAATSLYYQALKLISLCGWVPRVLPYVVECKDQTSQSSKNAHPSNSLTQSLKGYSITINSLTDADAVGEETNNHPPLEHESDPASVVLDCSLCGACVGLWTFTVIPRPLEHFSLIESPDANDQNVSATSGANTYRGQSHIFSSGTHNTDKGIMNHQSNGTEGNDRSSSLNLAIGGGPPPEKQNFTPRVSLPIVSRHLRAGLGSKSDVRNHSSSTGASRLSTHCSTKGNDSSNKQDDNIGSVLDSGSESAETLKRKRDEDECCISRESNLIAKPNQIGENSIDPMQKRPDDVGRSDEFSQDIEVGGSSNPDMDVNIGNRVGGSPCTTTDTNVIIVDAQTCERVSFKEPSSSYSQHDNVLPGVNTAVYDVTCDIDNKGSHTEPSSETNASVDNTCEGDQGDGNKGIANDQNVNALNNELVEAHVSGTNIEPAYRVDTREFDPIRQHKPFCSWIAHGDGDGEHLPGWKVTLRALHQDKDSSHALLKEAQSAFFDEVDDPIISVRKLFASPPSKRFKGAQ